MSEAVKLPVCSLVDTCKKANQTVDIEIQALLTAAVALAETCGISVEVLRECMEQVLPRPPMSERH